MSVELLNEREKETLRLLLEGHDAKSIARDLNLSVYTVNDRLRDARRKLGVSSSRQAARLLAQTQDEHPNFLAYKKFGVAEPVIAAQQNEHPDKLASRSRHFGWLIGGLLMLSLIIAASIFVNNGVGDGTKAVGFSKGDTSPSYLFHIFRTGFAGMPE